jgi:hypothetical protein
MADTERVPTFVVGAELDSLVAEPEWHGLITKVRKVFHGQLAYSADWYPFELGAPNPPVDRIGVDAYFPVGAGNNATVGQLVDDWNAWWDALPRSIHPSKIVIDEIGIPAQDGAYEAPFSYGNPDLPLNFSIQSKWFTAACEVVQRRHIAGMYFWNVAFDYDPEGLSSPLSFVGRPGAEAIKRCFQGWNHR